MSSVVDVIESDVMVDVGGVSRGVGEACDVIIAIHANNVINRSITRNILV